jgi:hypothetical protein
VPPIHSVGVSASHLAEQLPIESSGSGTHALDALRLAGAAVATAGDAVVRYGAIGASLDHGLFGGDVSAGGGGHTLTLTRDQLIPGVAISGTIKLSPAIDPLDGLSALAQLTASAPGLRSASFTAAWNTQGAGALAQVAGVVGAEPVAGTTPAP